MPKYADPANVLSACVADAGLSSEAREEIVTRAADYVRKIRADRNPGLMEMFLSEYGLSTEEGIALMCLAEALLRVPDADTIDALIEDKIAPSDWAKHMGHSASPLVNASTWALMLTGRVLEDPKPGIAGHLRGAVRRLGEPVIRRAVARAMREMGRQFVLGEDMPRAMNRAAGMEAKGYTYSYDMLGEAARTAADAARYLTAYRGAIEVMAPRATKGDIRRNPGLSVKFSALHPRYEVAQADRVLRDLVPVVRDLAQKAKAAGIGLNVDAEEADRLELSLAVIERVLEDPALAGWDGFGVVVQAYGQRAGAAIDWIDALAERLDRRVMVRLVKGAYWDTEVKHAQTMGMDGFPVFTDKAATDVSYLGNARRLLQKRARIYPQFATHNAHTVAAILKMVEDEGAAHDSFEFQRLHGMGERLHDLVMADHGTRCRIYAPVGAHRDLLAYLVRRLLENGANSSFVNRIVDTRVPPEAVVPCPFDAMQTNRRLPTGADLYRPERANSAGFDLTDPAQLDRIDVARDPHRQAEFSAAPMLAETPAAAQTEPGDGPAPTPRPSPVDPADVPGHVRDASPADIDAALDAAQVWSAPREERARVLSAAADLYEQDFGALFALLAREAGKTMTDAVAELREAVDFLRYYAARLPDQAPLGRVTCISPWNFPLAIFSGQIAAALGAGNAVLAKPAPQTPLIAARAIAHLHAAGVPAGALQLLPGGGEVGAALTSDPRVDGVVFTGSTATARHIARAMADTLAPGAPLIAETGGLNAMIVDSTALPEQAVRDILASAFQSAGQRCSALRCLYVQEDIAGSFKKMLFGAMDALETGDPWELGTDSGPLIDAAVHGRISGYVEAARTEGRVLHEATQSGPGHALPPVVIEVPGIGAMEDEIFGPVLHLATYRSDEIDAVIDAINARGYGLTFGLHTRIDDRVQHVVERLTVGNLYVNRNQIGAVVGSQPFGGEGLSGTGPKAGGPLYLPKFTRPETPAPGAQDDAARPVNAAQLQADIDAARLRTPPEVALLPGPTGETNRLTTFPRAPVLCLGPGAQTAAQQADAVTAAGGLAVVPGGQVPPETLAQLGGFGGAIWWGEAEAGRAHARALADREGPILQLLTGVPRRSDVLHERHLCVDTTASGGNAALLAEMGNTP
ncbi:bifunctional proline dehydrogenase/L-glutamate gamma-semialdehyde dehydrogenase PutA [Mesobaculum littorinae]|uniref:Bifunctional protein PutA n=2 Tax=Mesobaculum littorinae TaxID=2486419 RepID=A0A438AN26_9RHOB|nr:bifunctional proline dehydrogenase/L-glutamate gamma-semialdehyde dehydrogenase PutA [Mesobaculum littorinae]